MLKHKLFWFGVGLGLVETILWPVQSPDLNPLSWCWDELDRRLKAKQYHIFIGTSTTDMERTFWIILDICCRKNECVISVYSGYFDELLTLGVLKNFTSSVNAGNTMCFMKRVKLQYSLDLVYLLVETTQSVNRRRGGLEHGRQLAESSNSECVEWYLFGWIHTCKNLFI